MSAGNHASVDVIFIGGRAPKMLALSCFQADVQPEFWEEIQFVPTMDAPEVMPAGSCVKAVVGKTAWASQWRTVR